MRADLVAYLRDPEDGSPLRIEVGASGAKDDIVEGELISSSGRRYVIRRGIPRFLSRGGEGEKSVHAFGEQWNRFSWGVLKGNWLNHTVANTFGSPDVFRGKLVIDAGAGAGMQSVWMAEYGARRVLSLELSHSIDGALMNNVSGVREIDAIQCSIDAPPLRPEIADIVYCHNVIQHTPSVENTARALWRLVAPGGELVFNCYPRNDLGVLRWIRLRLHLTLRAILSRLPFSMLLAYARVLAALRFVPVIGWTLEKAGLVNLGSVPAGPGWRRAAYNAAVANTVDGFGGHAYQHLKSEAEIRALVSELQPDTSLVGNLEKYFSRPQPIGCALRIRKMAI